MADSVKIVFDAVDNASGVVGKIQQGFSAFNNVLYAAETIAKKVGEAIDATAGEAVNYANQIRDLQYVSGQTAEESSRMIQVFDDFKIQIEELTPAIRKMTSEGLTPNLRTVAQLSDEYNNLATPLEKNRFLMEKFGRTGLKMAEMMSKGSVEILAMADAVDENLIVTQEAVDAARRYELAMDNLGDTVQGVKIAVGNQLIPALTDFVESMLISGQYTDHQARQMGYLKMAFDDGSISIEEARAKALEFGIALGDLPSWMAIDIEVSADGLDEITEQLDDIFSHESQVNFMLNFQSNADSTEQKLKDLYASQEETVAKIKEVEGQIASGDITPEDGAEQLETYRAKVIETTNAINDAVAAQEQFKKNMAFQMLFEKFKSSGGEMTDEEMGALLEVGKELGVLDQETIATVTGMLEAITDVDPGNLSDALADIKQLVAMDGKTVTIYVNQVTTTTTDSGTGTGTGATTEGATTTTSGATATVPTVNVTFNAPGFYPDILASLRG